MKATITVNQITHGVEYEGTIEGISTRAIKYKLLFGVPIKELNSQKMPEDKEDSYKMAKKLFQFTVTKNGKDIEISNELFSFMIQTAGQLALTFYNDEQTQDYNTGESLLSQALRDKEKSLLGVFGANVSIGMSCELEIEEVQIPKALLGD